MLCCIRRKEESGEEVTAKERAREVLEEVFEGEEAVGESITWKLALNMAREGKWEDDGPEWEAAILAWKKLSEGEGGSR